MTIAGSDPSGGAGVQADLKTFAALKVYGLSVITALIAQNSARVTRVWAAGPEMISAQMATVVSERRPDAIKIGALASASVARAVAKRLQSLRLPAPVIDPVLVSSSGARLIEPAGERVLRTELIPLACLVTPNVAEAEALSGVRIDRPDAMREAARAIHKNGARAVLIKGGHSPALSNGRDRATEIVDLFFDGRRFIEFVAPRIPVEGAHGTGCALSAAITAWLARGEELEAAIERAKQFMSGALKNAFSLGRGRPVLDHFAR
jgi:hydroxymethylpyrimidine/phosphomethylpyrimidine kinase